MGGAGPEGGVDGAVGPVGVVVGAIMGASISGVGEGESTGVGGELVGGVVGAPLEVTAPGEGPSAREGEGCDCAEEKRRSDEGMVVPVVLEALSDGGDTAEEGALAGEGGGTWSLGEHFHSVPCSSVWQLVCGCV